MLDLQSLLPPPRGFCEGFKQQIVTDNEGKPSEWKIDVSKFKKETVCGKENGHVV